MRAEPLTGAVAGGRNGRLTPRLFAALVAGKLAARASRVLGRGGGTSLPGVVARRVAPDILAQIRLGSGVRTVLITGSNGKTTTARFVTGLLRGQGIQVATNSAGANLVQGVTSMVVEAAGLRGRVRSGVLVGEVDEAAVAPVASQIPPDVLLLTNLFRDQLDRFGELHAVARALGGVAERLPATSTWIVNADDPMAASLAADRTGKRLTFGFALDRSTDQITRAADTIRCPRCSSDLVYERVYLSHLGDYRCPTCHFARPELDVAVVALDTIAIGRTNMTLRTAAGEMSISIPQSGVHIAYDAAAAVAVLLALETPLDQVVASFASVAPAFGRLEPIRAGERDVILGFVKNPTSFNTTLNSLMPHNEPRHLLLAMSSSLVDGEDFAWLWDVNLESVATRLERVTVAGTRADELANRLKYAGVDVSMTEVVGELEPALDRALGGLPAGIPLVILAGYTPTIQLRQIMERRGWVGPYWEA